MKRLLALLVIALLALPLTATNIVGAQDSARTVNLSISPAIFELAVEPGALVETSITLFNNSNTPIGGTLEPDTLIPIDDVVDQGRRSEFDASSWVTVAEPNLLFEPNSSQTIDVSIAVPETANPGGHYAVITFAPAVAIGLVDTDTQVQAQISASLFLTVAGDINEAAEIIDTDLDTGFIASGSEHEFEFRIRNTGNVHILPAPVLRIFQGTETVSTQPLQPQLILPNTEKTFTATWNADAGIGSYSAKAEATYGNEGIPLATTEVSFWVVPNVMQILIFVVLLPLLIWILIKRKNIPRTIAVLRGHAMFSGKNYSRSGGDEALPDAVDEVRSVDEIAKELERPTPILGYPTEPSKPIDAGASPISVEKKTPPKRPATPPLVISKTRIDSDDTTTFITQTSASTIVRERSPFFEPVAEPMKKPMKIEVAHVDEEADAPLAKKVATKKKVTKKKPSAPKKSIAKKSVKAPAKTKKASTKKKTTTKKPAAKKTTKPKPTKKTAKKKPITKKSSTSKKAAKK